MPQRASTHSCGKLKKICKYTITVSRSKNIVKPRYSFQSAFDMYLCSLLRHYNSKTSSFSIFKATSAKDMVP